MLQGKLRTPESPSLAIWAAMIGHRTTVRPASVNLDAVGRVLSDPGHKARPAWWPVHTNINLSIEVIEGATVTFAACPSV